MPVETLPSAQNAAPRVSVLMCAYNSGRYIGAAIQSILDQTLRDLELIVIDDGSTDDTRAVIHAYAAKDTRVFPKQTPHNLGAPGALNVGLVCARGVFITRQDSDDLAAPERLEKQLAFLQANPEIGAVGSDVLYIGPNDEPLDKSTFITGNNEIQAQLLSQMCFCGPTVMMRRPALQSAGFWMDAELAGSEDYDVVLRLAEVTELANLPEPLYMYRQHLMSVSHTSRFQQMERTALTQEKAIHRRYRPDEWPDKLTPIGLSHLRAAVLAAGVGYQDEARASLNKALTLDPTLLEADEPLVHVIERYTRNIPLQDAVEFVNRVFEYLLPPTRQMLSIQNRLLSGFYMAEVFETTNERNNQNLRAYLLAGVRHDPRWLLNRGVIAMLARQAMIRKTDHRAESA